MPRRFTSFTFTFLVTTMLPIGFALAQGGGAGAGAAGVGGKVAWVRAQVAPPSEAALRLERLVAACPARIAALWAVRTPMAVPPGGLLAPPSGNSTVGGVMGDYGRW
jgi:hypothetical protein